MFTLSMSFPQVPGLRKIISFPSEKRKQDLTVKGKRMGREDINPWSSGLQGAEGVLEKEELQGQGKKAF